MASFIEQVWDERRAQALQQQEQERKERNKAAEMDRQRLIVREKFISELKRDLVFTAAQKKRHFGIGGSIQKWTRTNDEGQAFVFHTRPDIEYIRDQVEQIMQGNGSCRVIHDPETAYYWMECDLPSIGPDTRIPDDI